MAAADQKQTGAPPDFGGPIFPNPSGVQPRWDTDPSIDPTPLPKGVSFHKDNWTGPAPTDISNPPTADVLPTMGRTISAKSGGTDDPFASIAKPVKGQSNDPFASIAKPAGGGTKSVASSGAKPPADTRSSFERFAEDPNPIQMTSYPQATLYGLRNIAQGAAQAGLGGWNLLKTAARAWNDPHADVGNAILPDPHAEQVPGAIKDINASPDPLGTYGKVAADTAGQGAGQALAALATEGARRGIPKVVEGSVNTVKGAAKASGIGLTPVEKLVKSAGPSVRDLNFPQAIETAAPELARQNAAAPIKSVQGVADAAHVGADSLWKNQIEPQITRNASATIDGGKIADQIRSGVDEGMKDLFPEQAKAANSFADKFQGQLTLSKANAYLKTLNAQLKGFYKMSPEARAAAGVTDGRISSMENAADGLRQQMYDKLDSLGETDPAGLRQQYGALKQVQDVFRKRAIVAGRQAPLNLPQVLALAGGAGEATSALMSGHPMAALGGAAAAAIPTILKFINSPDALAARGISGLKLPEALQAASAPPIPEPVPRSLGAAAAAPAAEEVPGMLREGAGLDRRATPRSAPMNATELEAAIKQRKPLQTPFDVTSGASDTIKNDPLMQKAIQQMREEQGGHAGGGVASEEELSRSGNNYMVSKQGKLTYHGKAFAPEETPKGAAHVTVLPDGKFRVNAGTLTPAMETALKNGIKK